MSQTLVPALSFFERYDRYGFSRATEKPSFLARLKTWRISCLFRLLGIAQRTKRLKKPRTGIGRRGAKRLPILRDPAGTSRRPSEPGTGHQDACSRLSTAAALLNKYVTGNLSQARGGNRSRLMRRA